MSRLPSAPILCLITFTLAPATGLFAQVQPQPVGPPLARPTYRFGAIPPKGSFSVSIDASRVFSRDLDNAAVKGTQYDAALDFVSSIDPDTETTRVELKSNAFMARIAYSLFTSDEAPFGMEAYGLVGVADLTYNGRVDGPDDEFQLFNGEGDYAVAYGGGLRAQVYEYHDLRVFVDGWMRLSFHDTSVVQVDELGLTVPPGDTAVQDFDSRFFSWQVAAYVSYAFEAGGFSMVPYGGFRFSGVNVKLDGEQRLYDSGIFDGQQSLEWNAHQRDVFGLFAGFEVGFTEWLGAFVEIGFIDQFTVAAGGTITF